MDTHVWRSHSQNDKSNELHLPPKIQRLISSKPKVPMYNHLGWSFSNDLPQFLPLLCFSCCSLSSQSPAFGQAITCLFLRCNTHLVAAITLIMVVKAPLLLPPTLVLSTQRIKLSGKVILKGGGLILLGRQSRKGKGWLKKRHDDVINSCVGSAF